jgi:hypothetical protein
MLNNFISLRGFGPEHNSKVFWYHLLTTTAVTIVVVVVVFGGVRGSCKTFCQEHNS